MRLNVQIDDLQEAKFIEPIFNSLIKNNASNELIKNVFFDSGIPQYFQYLPNSLRIDPVFIKECLEKKLINIDNVPKEFLTKDFISKDLYLSLVADDFNFLKINLL